MVYLTLKNVNCNTPFSERVTYLMHHEDHKRNSTLIPNTVETHNDCRSRCNANSTCIAYQMADLSSYGNTGLVCTLFRYVDPAIINAMIYDEGLKEYECNEICTCYINHEKITFQEEVNE